jgi:hypothetical protein
MAEKVATPPEKGDPKAQPVRRPAPQDPAQRSDERKHPPRDTRDAPAPNPNGDPVTSLVRAPKTRYAPVAQDALRLRPFPIMVDSWGSGTSR